MQAGGKEDTAAVARTYGKVAGRIRLATLVAVGLIVAFAVFVALTLERRELRDTRQRIDLLSTLLSEETSRSFKNVDLVLESLVDETERDGVATPEAFAESRSGKAGHDRLASRRQGLPQVDTISFVDARGQLLATTRSFPAAPRDLSDRDYFKELARTPSTAPFMSMPTRARSEAGQRAMFVARRIQAPDGTFLGVVVCGIDLDAYQGLYGSLDIGRGISIGLWRRDGTSLVRFPATDVDVGKRPDWVDEMGRGRSASYETDSGFDGHARLVSARATADLNLVVSVSSRRSVALADWRLFILFLSCATLSAIVAIVTAGEATRARYLALGQRDAALADRERVVEQRETAEAQLRQSQKMEAVGQLAGGIAHDFNNMLSVVVGSLGVLSRRLSRGETDVARFVDAATEAANRASGLTRRLLALSRNRDIEPEVLEIDAFLAQVAEIAMRTVGRSLRFEVALGAPSARVLVDPSQLENAILNLAINARDAMPAGGVIRLSSGIAGGATPQVEISLSDTGTGMSDEVLEQARAPFFTTKAEGAGTGLGLSQVAAFGERSGGRMEIESRLGHGTTVRILIPVTESRAGNRVGSDDIPAPSEPGVSILVVDDEDSVRATTVAMLRDLGYRVQDAGDAAAALGMVGNMPDIALLVSDVVMPGGDGPSLVRDAMRLSPRLRGLLVSGLDGHGRDEGIPTLAKPFDLGQLARSVRDALDRAPDQAARGIAA